jgi:hypothetical protein
MFDLLSIEHGRRVVATAGAGALTFWEADPAR